ncbi:MAG: TetR family transcriptional regulator [Gammaproteobacteria bacterium]|nr:TetR family transcriptional regulator [Gammaproteobacteria bacterium]
MLRAPCGDEMAIRELPVSAAESGAAKTDWRERRRVALRASILRSAEDLIRDTGGTDFTMRNLADNADVALATPYGLFGSKAAVFYALLEDCVSEIDKQVDRSVLPDPIEQMLAVSRISADLYGSDAVLYRPLLRFLMGSHEPEHHLALFGRAMKLWDSAIVRGVRSGSLQPQVRAEVLERQLLANFTGVLQFWIQGELDGPGFRNHVLLGTMLILIPYAAEPLRPGLLQRLIRLEKTLPKELLKPVPAKRRRKKTRRSQVASTD